MAPEMPDGHYLYWAQEGVPYYWILVISDPAEMVVLGGIVYVP